MDSVILESVNLNDLAYEEIKKRIISREFAPGQRLVDSQLATIFQISRTPIRDAMRRLTKEGLLTNTSSRGFYVFAPTLKDIDEIFSISGMIETEAAARIIRRLRENPSPRLEEELNILEKKASEVFPMEKDEEFKRSHDGARRKSEAIRYLFAKSWTAGFAGKHHSSWENRRDRQLSR